MDGRKNNGGHSTKGKAGRPPKSIEQKQIEVLTPLEPLALEVHKKALEKGEAWAVKLFYDFYYTKPKHPDTKEGEDSKTVINYPISTWV